MPWVASASICAETAAASWPGRVAVNWAVPSSNATAPVTYGAA